MLKTYFDGSWDSRCMSLAGLAADEDVWSYFDHEWRGILANRGNARYMHMKEAMPLEKEFKGWSAEKRDFLLIGLLGLLMEVGQHKKFHAFTCSVDLAAHDRWQARNRLPAAARLCARIAFPKMLDWYSEFPDPILDTIDVFFDRNEPFIGHISNDWNNLKLRKKYPVWGLVRTVAPAEMLLTPGVQAADMLAWSAHRLIIKKLEGQRGLVIPQKYLLADSSTAFLKMATDIFNAPAGWHALLDEYTLATRRFPEHKDLPYFLRRKPPKN